VRHQGHEVEPASVSECCAPSGAQLELTSVSECCAPSGARGRAYISKRVLAVCIYGHDHVSTISRREPRPQRCPLAPPRRSTSAPARATTSAVRSQLPSSITVPPCRRGGLGPGARSSGIAVVGGEDGGDTAHVNLSYNAKR